MRNQIYEMRKLEQSILSLMLKGPQEAGLPKTFIRGYFWKPKSESRKR